jgi:hypothetical protein
VSTPALAQPTKGPLTVHPTNPRYFADSTGKPVYLTGSHTWLNLQDGAFGDHAAPFDYGGFLQFLKDYNHNFFRLWAWEGPAWVLPSSSVVQLDPLPFERTGPGLALDGKPKFDVTRLNPAYFARLRQRVQAAQQEDLYTAVMLFQGFSVARKSRQRKETPWRWHPLHRDNNVNGLDGDADGDGEGYEVHTLADPQITRVQEAYVRAVVRAVGDCDNVLYEISNESHGASKEWQYHFIRFLHGLEQMTPRQHPVLMSFTWDGLPGEGTDRDLFESPAEAVAPVGDAGRRARTYRDAPPAANGTKVVIPDTDHLWGIGGDVAWVWKCFTRGLNPIFMDPYFSSPHHPEPTLDPRWEAVRRAMGQTRALAQRLDMATMTPHNALASTGYCLAAPGSTYVAFLPTGGRVTLDLGAATGAFGVEWIDPVTGTVSQAKDITGGTADAMLTAPFAEGAVLHLWPKVRGR